MALIKKIHVLLKKIPLHPILFSIFNVLYFFVGFRWSTTKWELIVVGLVSVLFATIIWMFIFSFLRKRYKSAIVVSMIVILFFQLDAIYEWLIDIKWFPVTVNTFLTTILGQYLIFLFILLLIVVFTLVRSKKDFKLVSLFLDIVAVTMTLYMVLMVVKNQTGIAAHNGEDSNSLMTGWSEYSNNEFKKINSSKDYAGDIYYLVFDGYGSHQTLLDLYDYSNAEFLNFLTSRGFKVVNDATTNYNQTRFSISSALNFNYIQNITSALGVEQEGTFAPIYWTNKNLVFEFLRNQGYKTVTFSTGIDITDVIMSDIHLSPDDLPKPYLNEIVNNSILSLIYWKDQYRWNASRIEFALHQVGELSSYDFPIFVYAHIMIPHPPFIFQPDGNFQIPTKKFDYRDNSAFTRLDLRDNYLRGYRNQVEYASRRIMEIVEKIQTKSPNSIIIIQGDHGPGAYFEQEDLESSVIDEKFHILNAYYFPDGDYSNIPDDITPVNSFRIVFNKFFGTSMEILENTSYYSGYIQPYEFVEITSKLR